MGLGAAGCLLLPELVLGWQDREELEEEVRTRVAVEVRTILERMETSWQVASCPHACSGMSCGLRAVLGSLAYLATWDQGEETVSRTALAVHRLI